MWTFLKKKSWFLLIFFMVAAFFLDQSRFSPTAAETDRAYPYLKIFTEALSEIQKKYVEEKPAKELVYGAIRGMLGSLDPHSSFMTPEEFKELEIETSGTFSGIGIEITLKDNLLTVVSPIEGTPADQAGIRSGDIIIKINGKVSKNITLNEAVRLIRGPKGTQVTLTILRDDLKEPRDFVITREIIPLKSVWTLLLDPKHPYIRISTFQENTTKDLSEVLSRYESGNQPIEGMILDLRNNPGGLLNEAVKVSDLFLESGLIVYTQGRIKEQNLKFYAHKNKTPQPYSMVVLVNEGSASASEIVAGALQDHKRAIIMGAPTFGKGSVQTIIPLEDQSGLRLTTSLYYTPSGRSIQAKGIVPDIEMKEEKSSVKREVKEVRPLREKDLDRHLEDQNQPREKQDGKKPEEKSAPKTKESKENKDTKVSREQTIRTDPLVLRALDLLKGWEILNKRSKS